MLEKKVIKGKIYNTTTAELVDEFFNGRDCTDFRKEREQLYRTKKGSWFLCGEGGCLSKWGENYGNTKAPGADIKVLSEPEAKEWLEQFSDADTFEKYFDVTEA